MALFCVHEHFWVFSCLMRRLCVPFLGLGIPVGAIYRGPGGSALSVMEFCLQGARYPGPA